MAAELFRLYSYTDKTETQLIALSNLGCFLDDLIAEVQKAEEPVDVLTARKRVTLFCTVLCKLSPAKQTIEHQ